MPNIISRIGELYGPYEVIERDLSKPKGGAAYWKVKCQSCGAIRSVRADSLKRLKICHFCSAGKGMIGKVFGDFLVQAQLSERTENNSLIYSCQCIHCGHVENVLGTVLRSNKKYCSKCHEHKSTLIDMTGQTYGYLTVLQRDLSEEHMGHENDSWWICRCNLCGTIKSIRGISLRNGTTKSCGCVKSHGELTIANILSQNNIIFEREYTFPDLIYKDKLRFDFAIFEKGQLSHLVEYDGIQHFKARNSGWNTDEALQQTQLRDQIKTQYCKDNNIKLVRIKYDEEITLDKIMGR